jgi:cytochrome c biogenesis protein CcmG, thiol:disulfide interchange protein DsbE
VSRGRAARGVRALALLAALVLAGCTAEDPAPPPAPTGEARAVVTVGCPTPGRQSTAATALPDLELACLGSGEGSVPLPLRRLTGTPTVLNLWASWCAPCRQELPALARLHRAGAGRVRVLGVASQDRPGTALAYAADGQLPFASLADPDGRLARALRRPGLPVTVFLAADGSVTDVYQGPPLADGPLRVLVRDKLGVDVG